MARVGNVSIRRQGMCIGACIAGPIIIFRRQLFYIGDAVKKSLLLSFPTAEKLSVLLAWIPLG